MESPRTLLIDVVILQFLLGQEVCHRMINTGKFNESRTFVGLNRMLPSALLVRNEGSKQKTNYL